MKGSRGGQLKLGAFLWEKKRETIWHFTQSAWPLAQVSQSREVSSPGRASGTAGQMPITVPRFPPPIVNKVWSANQTHMAVRSILKYTKTIGEMRSIPVRDERTELPSFSCTYIILSEGLWVGPGVFILTLYRYVLTRFDLHLKTVKWQIL